MVGKEENGIDASSENLLIPHDEMRLTYLKYFRTYSRNTDGSSTTAVSNSFFSPLENFHSGRYRIIKSDFSFLCCKWYVVCTH